jgi:hypothetical protein
MSKQAGRADDAVYTRYDTLDEIRGYLPPSLSVVAVRGIRIVTPVAQIHRLPVAGALVRRLEHRLADMPVLRNLGGFLAVVAQKQSR